MIRHLRRVSKGIPDSNPSRPADLPRPVRLSPGDGFFGSLPFTVTRDKNIVTPLIMHPLRTAQSFQKLRFP